MAPHTELVFPSLHDHDFRIPPMENKQLRFSNRVSVFPVLHVTEYSKAEKRSTWYSRKEIKEIRQGNRDFMKPPETGIMCFDATDTTLDEQTTVRGLESKTLMGALRKRRHKVQALRIVFFEQQRQQLLGCFDPDAIADAYYEIAEPCQVAAHMLALRDARESEWIQLGTYDPWTIEKENTTQRQSRHRPKKGQRYASFGPRHTNMKAYRSSAE